MRVGFIGTGVMGARMVQRFIKAKYPVKVYNRTAEKARKLQELGASIAGDIPSLVVDSDVICTCLSMPNDVEEVYLGEQGILNSVRAHTICIDFTTVDPATSNLIERKAAKKDICYLDAPVSGGPEGVEAGTLTVMVGGEKKGFDNVLSLLQTIGNTIEYLGPSGNGSIAKLINQYLVAVHSIAASEAMITGTALGLEAEKLYNLLKVSYGSSRMLARHMESFVLPRQFEPGGAVKYVHKDVKLANPLFAKAGLEQYTGQLAEKAFAEAMKLGFSNNDMSAVIRPLEQTCNVVVEKK